MLIQINRNLIYTSKDPDFLGWDSPELQNTGPTEYQTENIVGVRFGRDPNKTYDALKKSGEINKCLGILDLMTLVDDDEAYFTKGFIVGLRSVAKSRIGPLSVPYIADGQIEWGWLHDFGGEDSFFQKWEQ
jgi:hypothetical protein